MSDNSNSPEDSPPPGSHIAVAMSGGVDSSVAAALLVEAGYRVTGVTMDLVGLYPPWLTDDEAALLPQVDYASKVASDLAIPHHILDLREEFTNLVLGDFTRQYALGRTPNPCVRCNSLIKFGALRERVRSMGIHYLATGHYALRGWLAEGERWSLRRGKDRSKDQSYALWALSQDDLAHAVFPLGTFSKQAVYSMLRERGLPAVRSRESQDLCFLPRGMGKSSFLEASGSLVPGRFVTKDGRELGEHAGVGNYTIGQRRGLRVASGRRLYVVGIDAASNTVTLGERSDLLSRGLTGVHVNFTVSPAGGTPRASVQIRYRHRAAPARVTITGESQLRVDFESPQAAVTPGQSAVLYRGDLLLGGCVIEEALPGI